ncbi:RagB/SusD family nutrient uptake outer membrane protein [soil metagenome]
MKTKIYIISLIFFGLSACDDILDVKPVTFSSGTSYYQTVGQIQTAVNGAYGVLQTLYTSDFWVFTEMRSDNTTYHYNPNNRCCISREEVDEFLNTSVDRYTESNWRIMYYGIQQSNVILNRIEGVLFSDQAKKDQFIGEAKFLRALYYFHLVRLHGPLPLIIEEIEGPTQAFTNERASVEQVYGQIIKDAKDAAISLPDSYTSSELGRTTKGAALTLLGEVYLTLKDYTSAVSTLEQVIALNYMLVPEYADLFNPNNKNNSESVFEIQYNAGVEGENSNFIFLFGPYNAAFDLTGFQGQLWGLNIPTLNIVEAYEEGDTRKEASIGFYVNPDNTAHFESIGDAIPFIKKYYHPPYIQQGRADENWPVYRYAHVLLMLAEALNEEGRTEEAYQYINLVRQRAGLDPLSGLSQDAFREAVYHEERVELAFENHRWFDLLRTGRALEVMNAHGIEEKERLGRLSTASFNVQEYMLLFPIPEKEIRLNKYEQNPGW